MSNKIGFAVLGLGHIGQKHCLHIFENPDAALIATADINPNLKYGSFVNQINIDIDLVLCCCSRFLSLLELLVISSPVLPPLLLLMVVA